MIGRWLAGLRRMQDFADFERECVQALSCGVGPAEVRDTLYHHELGTPFGFGHRDAVVVRSLARLAIVGVPGHARRNLLLGMVHRYQECFGPGELPTGPLERAVLALVAVIGRGRVPRQEFAQFVEIFPQFHRDLGRDPRSGDVLNWFEHWFEKYIPAP